MVLPVGMFTQGRAPLRRLEAVHDFALQNGQGAAVEVKLAELFRAHPVFMLQLGISTYIMLSYAMEWAMRSSMSAEYQMLVRAQSLLCSLFVYLLDAIMRMSVSGDVTLTTTVVAETMTTKTDEGGAPDNSTTNSTVTRTVDMTSLPVDKEFLQRARGDMLALAQGREGLGAAYAAISLVCGSPRFSTLPALIRACPLIARSLVLVVACAVPMPQLLTAIAGVGVGISDEDKASAASAKGKKSKGKKRGAKGKAAASPSATVAGIVALLFPSTQRSLPLQQQQPDESLDALAEMVALPLEFFIMRQWSHTPKPPKGSAAAAAAAAVKQSTTSAIAHFVVMLVKSWVVMAYLKARLRSLLSLLDPPPVPALASEDDAGAVAEEKVFFMARWPFFKDPIVRNVLTLAKGFLSPEGAPPGANPFGFNPPDALSDSEAGTEAEAIEDAGEKAARDDVGAETAPLLEAATRQSETGKREVEAEAEAAEAGGEETAPRTTTKAKGKAKGKAKKTTTGRKKGGEAPES